jgi:3-deoxy-D-manno-octulosonic-acid transferase
MPLAKIAVNLASIFNPKLSARNKKQKQLFNEFKKNRKSIVGDRELVWFHAASMGEFEQAKPIIELLKSKNPDLFIFVSFFSPSGYENQKNYKYADYLAYMPYDGKSDAKEFISVLNPKLAVFIRYEIWLNHLSELKARNVRAVLLNATKPNSGKLDFYYKKAFHLFDKIFAMDEDSAKYFTDFIKHRSVQFLPDTRYDRIIEKARTNSASPILPKDLFGDNFVLVIGSSWTPDEDIIFPAVRKFNDSSVRKILMIVTPHEPTSDRIAEIQSKLSDSCLLSELLESPYKHGKSGEFNKHIIVDSIGKLLALYACADAAYIGGAFGAGVHSVTEPAGYSIPLACGTGMTNSPDAVEMLKLSALQTIANSDDFYKWISRLINNPEIAAFVSKKTEAFVKSKIGSTEKAYNEIFID